MPKKPNLSMNASPSLSAGQSSQPIASKLSNYTVFGVVLPPKARIPYGLQSMYGIGQARAVAICRQLGLSEHTRCGEREPEHIPMLSAAIRKMGFVIGSDRRRVEAQIMHRYVTLNTVKGIRLRLGFPVRGQRTRTNAKTARKLNSARVRSSSSKS
jgi:small subunit ribosomal protein S13